MELFLLDYHATEYVEGNRFKMFFMRIQYHILSRLALRTFHMDCTRIIIISVASIEHTTYIAQHILTRAIYTVHVFRKSCESLKLVMCS